MRAPASELAAIGRRFYARGWALGTSGNFSVVVSRRAAAAGDHGERPAQARARRRRRSSSATSTARVRAAGEANRRPRRFSIVEIVRRRGAGAVLHTHSVWSTMLSERHAAAGGLGIDGYEMLKGLSGVDLARASRVDSDSRQRSGHGPPRAAMVGRHARASIRPRTRSCSGDTASTRGARRSPRPSGTSRFSSFCSRRSDAPSEVDRKTRPIREAAGGCDGADTNSRREADPHRRW